MTHENIYNKTEYKYESYDDGTKYENHIEMNNIDSQRGNIDNNRFKPIYIDTQYFCAPKTNEEVLTSDQLFAKQTRPHIYPSSVPVIVKDTTRPYTYHTIKSYGHAQDSNYYVNFDHHVSSMPPSCYNNNYNNYNNSNNNKFETEHVSRPSFDNDSCVKTYFCTLLGCFACCLFQMKPF